MTAASCSTTNRVARDTAASSRLDLKNSSEIIFQLPLIAIDVGGKRIGVAVSDRLGVSCHGVACLYRNDSGWPRQLLKIVAEYGCKGIVIGLPKNMDGSEGAQAADCRKAGKELAEASSLPILFHDERLSTWTAKERLFAQGLNEKRVKEKLDQTAAAVILEDFIAAHPELKR